MKKLIFSALSIAILAAGMTSCGKSSKGKLSNDWKIESFDNSSTSVQSNGNKNVSTSKFAGTTVTTNYTSTINGTVMPTTVSTYTLQDPTFKINKDGTWERNSTKIDVTTTNNNITTSTQTTVNKSSGTWSFVGKNKNDDFKKNERVLFNTLSYSGNTTTVTSYANNVLPTTTSTSSSTSTYKVGENVTIYTITESKGKALELTSEENQTGTSTSGNTSSTSSYESSEKMNLVQ